MRPCLVECMEQASGTGAEAAIRTRGLTRYFRTKPAVLDMGFRVERGTVCSILGRNGSGKTTTMRLLLGLLPPTRGRCWLLGEESTRLRPETRARVGYLPEGLPLRPGVRVRQLQAHQARCWKHWNPEVYRSIVHHFDIDPGSKTNQLSRGQRAGLCLALALAPEPELLILDEPTLGLDQVAHRAVLEALVHFAQQRGNTVFIATHQLHDAERISDQLIIMDGGTVRASCSPETLLCRVRAYNLIFDTAPPPRGPLKIRGLLELSRSDRSLRLVLADPDADALTRIRDLGASAVRESELGLQEAVTAFMARTRQSEAAPADTSAPLWR